MVTDFDCWHPDHDRVEVSQILAVLESNAEHARALVARAARAAAERVTPCAAGCDRALDNALITAEGARDPELLRRLEAVAGRALRGR
jgi:5'-methylthioadenosine phosphorylase